MGQRMALLEFILWKTKKTVSDLESKPQGIPPQELVDAKANMATVQAEVAKIEGKKEELRKKIAEAEEAGSQVKANTSKGELKKLEDDGLPEDLVKSLIKAEAELAKAEKLE